MSALPVPVEALRSRASWHDQGAVCTRPEADQVLRYGLRQREVGTARRQGRRLLLMRKGCP
jgi:hypothetical protein